MRTLELERPLDEPSDLNDKKYRALSNGECIYQASKAVRLLIRDGEKFSFKFWADGKDFWYADLDQIKYLYRHPQFRRKIIDCNYWLWNSKAPEKEFMPGVSIEELGRELLKANIHVRLSKKDLRP